MCMRVTDFVKDDVDKEGRHDSCIEVCARFDEFFFFGGG
jgi:hypothetical protein